MSQIVKQTPHTKSNRRVSVLGFLSPPVKGVFLGSTFQWDMKDSSKSGRFLHSIQLLNYLIVFQKLGSDVYTLVGVLNGESGYHVSNPNTIKVSRA